MEFMLREKLEKKSIDLEIINNLLNHSDLDVDKILFNKDTRSLELSFQVTLYEKAKKIANKLMGLISYINVPVYKSVLKINNVRNYILEDTEQIGLYSLSEIKYDSTSKKISIITGVPLTFEVFVTILDIQFRIEDAPFKWVQETEWFGFW